MVREHEVFRFKLVDFEDAIIALDDSRPRAGSKLLIAKMAGSTFGRMHSCEPHIYTQCPKEATSSNPLSVLPPNMAPLCVPMEETLLEGRQVWRG